MTPSVQRALKPIASLRITVVLFALSMFLVFAGTLAQVHAGVWETVAAYFRSFWVWIDLQVFVPVSMGRVKGSFPFPGGFLLGSLLMLNLLAAHVSRFKMTWKRSGIILLHAGVIVLLAGEFVTGLAADEGNMTIDEGGSANFVEDGRTSELAVIDASDAQSDLVVVIPQAKLMRGKQGIRDPLLPFDVRVDEWMPNSVVFGPEQPKPPGVVTKATAGELRSVAAQSVGKVTGVEEQKVDSPSAYVTLTRDGKDLGTYLVSTRLLNQHVQLADGKTYVLSLRFKRTYKPYTIHLIDFKHDKFVGTETPRNFSSQVRLEDPSQNEDREALIYMNHPLRYGGDAFYQASFQPGDTGTILQVVRNPGWLMPYVACSMVTLGLIVHFGINLVAFVRKTL